MAERRTAGEALKISSDVKEFINHGPTGGPAGSRKARVGDDDQTEKVAKPRVAEGRPATKPRAPKLSTKQTHAKARVQKTVRFRPELIAQFEEQMRRIDESGDTLSFQDVMNEALKEWLAANTRRNRQAE